MNLSANGQFGGRALRALDIGGKKIPAGTKLPPDVVAKWSQNNRRGLATGGKVEWFNAPGAFEEPASRAIPDEVVSAAARASAPLPAVTEAELDPLTGQYGGVTLETITAGGVTLPAGVKVPAAMVMRWPLKNRAALASAGRVAYFKQPPSRAEAKALAKTEDALLASLLE